MNEQVTLQQVDRLLVRHSMGELTAEQTLAMMGDVMARYTDPQEDDTYAPSLPADRERFGSD